MIEMVTEFFDAFYAAMDKQVAKEWGSISLDKQQLVIENDDRKSGFSQNLSFLGNSQGNTDWNKVKMLYSKMEDEIKKML